MDDEIKEATERFKIQITEHLKKQKTYCQFLGCFVQYVEHYHIDKETITFTKPEEKMINSLPANVQKIAQEVLLIIEKYYPGLTARKYDSLGYPNREGSPALERAEMCIYIELMKAGAFNDALV
jgi:hypothetical protein